MGGENGQGFITVSRLKDVKAGVFDEISGVQSQQPFVINNQYSSVRVATGHAPLTVVAHDLSACGSKYYVLSKV
jgi:hypothetical protein